jgi:signal transduction histidine kinase
MNKTVRFLVTYHLPLMIILSAGVLVFEIYTHTIDQHLFLTDYEFWVEVVTYGFLLPILGIFILRTLENYLHEREQATKSLDAQLQFKQRMNRSTTWDQLVDSVLEYPEQVLPVVQTALHVKVKEKGVFELAGYWRQKGIITTPPPAILSTQEHLELFSPSVGTNLVRCNLSKSSKDTSKTSVFCLPLHRGDDLIAILHIELPVEMTIPGAQARYLTDIAPEIALMLSDGKFSRNNNLDEAITKYRKRIAQDLHDTLGQNISYLRLKCDMLVAEGGIKNISDMREELERMREAADQAYLQMRAGLETLNPSTCKDLAAMLQNQAEVIAKRASLRMEVKSHCGELTIPPELRMEIGLVFGEAVHNVEKHAQAENLAVQIYQESDGLYIQIDDDGIGFEVENFYREHSQNGHYGLESMRERVEELDGKFIITSLPGSGTSIFLKVPLPAEQGESY